MILKLLLVQKCMVDFYIQRIQKYENSCLNNILIIQEVVKYTITIVL